MCINGIVECRIRCVVIDRVACLPFGRTATITLSKRQIVISPLHMKLLPAAVLYEETLFSPKQTPISLAGDSFTDTYISYTYHSIKPPTADNNVF